MHKFVWWIQIRCYGLPLHTIRILSSSLPPTHHFKSLNKGSPIHPASTQSNLMPIAVQRRIDANCENQNNPWSRALWLAWTQILLASGRKCLGLRKGKYSEIHVKDFIESDINLLSMKSEQIFMDWGCKVHRDAERHVPKSVVLYRLRDCVCESGFEIF